jgi:hypothetical protein
VEPLFPHKPEHLLPEQQLQALEVQLAGGVAAQVLALDAAGVALLAGDAARLAKVVVLVDVELDVALRGGQRLGFFFLLYFFSLFFVFLFHCLSCFSSSPSFFLSFFSPFFLFFSFFFIFPTHTGWDRMPGGRVGEMADMGARCKRKRGS